MRGEISGLFIIKQIKNLGSGKALKKYGKTLDCISCTSSILHFSHALLLPACLITEQSTVEASLLVKYCTRKIISFMVI